MENVGIQKSPAERADATCPYFNLNIVNRWRPYGGECQLREDTYGVRQSPIDLHSLERDLATALGHGYKRRPRLKSRHPA